MRLVQVNGITLLVDDRLDNGSDVFRLGIMTGEGGSRCDFSVEEAKVVSLSFSVSGERIAAADEVKMSMVLSCRPFFEFLGCLE